MRVLIVDDHVLFAEAIRLTVAAFGIDVVGVATSGEEAIASIAAQAPDLILLDLGLPGEGGLTVGRTILERWPQIGVLAVTALSDRAAMNEALRIGFRGYLTKDTSVAEFATGIRAAANGETILSPRLTAPPTSELERDAALLSSKLTPREREVLALLVEGANGPAAARRLGISRNTVRTHVQSILTKLQVHSRLEAATFAVRHHMVELPISGLIDDRSIEVH